MRVAVGCPAIALTVTGQVTIATTASKLTLNRGKAAFIAGGGSELTITGQGEIMLADCPPLD